jgi:hypothetical protein
MYYSEVVPSTIVEVTTRSAGARSDLIWNDSGLEEFGRDALNI